jgi:hypothetical protein
MASPPASPPRQPKPFGVVSGALGTLVLALGAGIIGAYALDLHSHSCDRCGRHWKHFGAFNLGDEASHTCSSCGEVQWWKCGAPHVLRGSQFVAASMTNIALPSSQAYNPHELPVGAGTYVPSPPSLPSRMSGSYSRALGAPPAPSPILALQKRKVL